ncbi:HEAT repeat domain-containing protein [Chitinophaga sp. CF118]|uniref:HEAT repeat domain-containing protein n=1 Tax=Chitinophaga sp. CF118 TaxID=1884367 RepID=UPI0015A58BA3|nr:HEAT repeat domain-containing protein [Chitinophaga sp. CF118]
MKKILLILLICSGWFAQAQTLPAKMPGKFPATDSSRLAAEMKKLTAAGEAGLIARTLMLKPAKTGDNTALQYALGGYAYYVTQAAKEDTRKIASRAFCKALVRMPDVENKAFIISLLEICGDNKAVPVLKQYLTNKRLCDPATRALLQIKSPDAKVAILAALKKATGNSRITLIAALGQLRYLGALDDLTTYTASEDPLTRKTALLALANVGNGNSEPLLAAAAAKSQYKSDSTYATAAYLLYTWRLAENWPIGPAVKAAEKLLKNSHETAFRAAALKVLTETRSNDATMILMRAVDDTQPAYRAAAFKLAERMMTSGKAELWMIKAERSEAPVKAGVITMLGNSKQTVASKFIMKALSDKNPEVKLAAIQAVGVFGSSGMVPALLNSMKTADTLSVIAIRDVLLAIRGQDVLASVSASMAFQPPFAQAALREVLAIRRPAQ